MASDLPPPSADAAAASHALTQIIVAEIKATGGWMSFARYMELALYAPGLGYYAGGARKFGDFSDGGDFMTAPELTPLFGQAVARQVAQILQQVPAGEHPMVIEVGGGSGRLAADLLLALDALDAAPERYLILEVSGELRARQATTVAEFAPALAARVEWLEKLPEAFSGCLIANEVLDAMPTHILRWDSDGVRERGVGIAHERLCWSDEIYPAGSGGANSTEPELTAAADLLAPLPPGYESEINLAARAWVETLAKRLRTGALLLIDYGLPQHELYHASRNGGTLRCHYRHRVHNDPFWYPGLSDITSHVDFTAVADAGFRAGLDVLGYANQASFLINCGLGELLLERKGRSSVDADKATSLETSDETTAHQEGAGWNPTRFAADTLEGGREKDGLFAVADDDRSSNRSLRAQGAVNLLISPNEMGELFKVIILGRGLKEALIGFTQGNRVHAL